jgi:hypothetical protein
MNLTVGIGACSAAYIINVLSHLMEALFEFCLVRLYLLIVRLWLGTGYSDHEISPVSVSKSIFVSIGKEQVKWTS